MNNSNNDEIPFSPFSTKKQQNQFKTPTKSLNGSFCQLMDVDMEDDCNNLINCPEESQEFKNFTSIFSNETGWSSLSLS